MIVSFRNYSTGTIPWLLALIPQPCWFDDSLSKGVISNPTTKIFRLMKKPNLFYLPHPTEVKAEVD